MPDNSNAVIGKIQLVKAGYNDVTDLSQKFDVGFFEFVEANPGLNLEKLYPTTKLVIPTKYVLPQVPREGVVVNIAEMRLYFYDKKKHRVLTFPVGVGKAGWVTPITKVKIVDKEVNPDWVPTRSVRADFLAKYGYPLPRVVAPGPENPLGDYSIRLSLPTYLIHGTIEPAGVGQRVSAGCIRMFNQSVAQLFQRVRIGMPVNIVYEPYKAGFSNGKLYLEAHQPIEGRPKMSYKAAIERALASRPGVQVKVDWVKAKRVASLDMGIPRVIGRVIKKH